MSKTSKPYKMYIDFEFGEYNGFMNLDVIHDGTVHKVTPGEDNKARLELDFSLPTKVHLQTSGKGPMDTEQDEEGNITADKYVMIQNVRLENFDLVEEYLWRYIGSRDINGEWHEGAYFGFNSDMLLEFNETDIMEQFLESNFMCIYEEPPRPTFEKREE